MMSGEITEWLSFLTMNEEVESCTFFYWTYAMTNACLLFNAFPEMIETHAGEEKHNPFWLIFITEPQNFNSDVLSCTAQTLHAHEKRSKSLPQSVYGINAIPAGGRWLNFMSAWLNDRKVLDVPHQVQKVRCWRWLWHCSWLLFVYNCHVKIVTLNNICLDFARSQTWLLHGAFPKTPLRALWKLELVQMTVLDAVSRTALIPVWWM